MVDFSVSTSGAGGRVVLTVAGELDMATAPRLRDAFAAHHGDDVDIDAGDLTFIDSTGLSVLLAANRRWRESGRELRLLRTSRPLARLLELAGVDHVFPRADPPPEA